MSDIRQEIRPMPQQFRKKPVVVEAEQFVAADYPASNPFGVVLYHQKCEGQGACCSLDGKHFVNTLEGHHVASDGDWIIRGVAGEFYPCKPDIFADTYDPVPQQYATSALQSRPPESPNHD